MADSITDKDDAAAQKAYADAAAAKSDSKPKAAVENPAVEAPKSEAAAPEKAAAEAPAPKKSVASKVAKTPTAAAAKKPAASATAAKASAKPKPVKKAVTRKAPARKVATAKKTTPEKTLSKKTTGAAPAATPKTKDTTMATKTQTKTTNIASDMANEMQTRLAGMYEKGTEMTGEMVTFQRANAEAMAEAGKILFSGMQDLTRDAVEETRKAADQMSEDARLMAAAKSPTEFVKLQGDIMRRSFDHVVATGSKNTEAWIKLANEAFAPLTSRMSETVDKMNKLAA
ncbi:phasin family protein [Citromicrobium bathyomarinum]|uniref:phasin family protein n=1 Tax=Citromicrobium bathyomarinum TaxID=72174 RepID=UPI00315B3B04